MRINFKKLSSKTRTAEWTPHYFLTCSGLSVLSKITDEEATGRKQLWIYIPNFVKENVN